MHAASADSASFRGRRRPRQTGGKLARQLEAAGPAAPGRSHPRRSGSRPARRTLLRASHAVLRRQRSGALDRTMPGIRRAQPGCACPQASVSRVSPDLLVQDAPASRAGQAAQMGRRRLQVHLQPRARPALPVRQPRRRAKCCPTISCATYFRFADQIFHEQAERVRLSRRSTRAISTSSFIRRANTRGCWNVPGASKSPTKIPGPRATARRRASAGRKFR